MKNTDDLLFGRTHILRSDDLALTTVPPGSLTANLTPLKSANSVITPQTARILTGRPTRPDTAVIGARMFESPTDVAVTLICHEGSTGTLYWHVNDLSGELSSGSVAMSGYNSDALFPVATDLNGDGLDEVVVWASLDDGAGGSAPDRRDRGGRDESGKRPALRARMVDQTAPMAIADVTVAGQPRLMLAGHPSSSAGCGVGRIGLVLNAYTVDPTEPDADRGGLVAPAVVGGPTSACPSSTWRQAVSAPPPTISWPCSTPAMTTPSRSWRWTWTRAAIR